jgi:hypothetical protein
MNEQYGKWLDERLKKTIDSGKVEFDSEQWKQKYSAEYQALVSKTVKRPDVPRFLWTHPLVRAAAVVAVIALVIFLIPRRSDRRFEPMVVYRPEQSPAMMMSRLSLMRAYERGGMEAVDEQCEKAFKMLGHKTNKVSINELLNENNGNKPERKDL